VVISQDIRQTIHRLGLVDRPLCLHASFRSFGGVADGPGAIIAGLLAEGCTVIVPTFSWGFAVPPPPELRPARNGWDYERFKGPTSGIGRIYTPDTMEVDKDMGIISATVVAWPGRVRGYHPLCSFTAVGPLAHQLISGQKPSDVCAPLKRLAEAEGSIILMGVGLDKMTLLHLAEQRAGRTLFRRWANDLTGAPMAVETGGCSDGFDNFTPHLAPLLKVVHVGQSQWRVFSARQVLEVASRAIQEQPGLTHCGNSNCDRCRDAIAGGPILSH
jgi:aminoglycoside N3'-acetyltransferase